MKPLYFLKKNVSIINTLLLIIIISLLIINFGILLSDKSIDILVALAAITSTFFLFLAFKESKKANDYNTSQPLFEEFDHQIEQFKAIAKDDLFSDFTKSYINRYIKKDLLKNNEITYSKFIYPLKNLYKEITKTAIYDQYMSKLGFAKSTLIPNDTDDIILVQSMTIIFQGIQISILLLFNNYKRIYRLYESIDKSVLFISQKQILFTRLDKLYQEYEIISKAMIDKDPELEKVISFNTFKIDNDLIDRFSINFHDQMKNIYDNIKKIKSDGNYISVPYEDLLDITPI